jgi:SNF2 family DNA or RNA helicase
MRKFYQHQSDAFAYLARQAGSGALFMQMRLGKTLVAIRYLHSFPKDLKVLVVCPMEGIWAWKRELDLENKLYSILVGSKKQRLDNLQKKILSSWFIINYEGVRTIEEELKKEKWDAIILDESRRIANPKAKTTKALQSFPRPFAQRRIVLSGEPAPEGPLEYFEQYKFVYGGFMGCGNYWQFRNAYFQELAPHEWVPKPRILDQLKRQIREKGFFLSRKEAGMPDKKVYEVRTLKLPPDLQKIYKEIKKDFVASLNGIKLSTKWVPVQYLWLQQMASGWLSNKHLWAGKSFQLFELLSGELKNEQVVVWFRFNNALRYCFDLLKEFKVAKITGEESREKRESAINEFRAGRLRVLLLQIKCGKSAIDLSNSSTAIYFTNSHSLEERKQSEDRILNPSKKEPLLYLDLVTEGTVEADILQLLREKSGESQFYKSKLLEMLKKPNDNDLS